MDTIKSFSEIDSSEWPNLLGRREPESVDYAAPEALTAEIEKIVRERARAAEEARRTLGAPSEKVTMAQLAALTLNPWWPKRILNQGNTPHCVGFAGAGFGIAPPVEDDFYDRHGHQFYYACKEIDGQPGQENGSWIRTVMTLLTRMGLIRGWHYTNNVGVLVDWVTRVGPVIVGTRWYRGMFTPGADGLVTYTPGDQLVGGHAYVVVGYSQADDTLLFMNSWGERWGLKGFFRMKKNNFAQLIAGNYAEIALAAEVPH